MQNKSLKTTMLLIILMIAPLIAYSQDLQTAVDDSVVISRRAQRLCVKCLQNEPLKDSIISEQQQRIELKDSTIRIQTTMIDKAETTIGSLDVKLSDCNQSLVDLERKRKRGIKWAAGIGAAGGGILGWLLFGLVNK